MRLRRCCTVLALLLSGLVALAQTTIHVPADKPTIQAGIDAANNGDTVLVAPGTYYENIDFKGKAITVTSGATSYAGAAATIIDGGQIAATALFVTHETRASVLSGFTLRNGQTGVSIIDSAPTILDNVITANSCDGLLTTFGSPLVQGNDISASVQAPTGGVNSSLVYCELLGAGVDVLGNSTAGGLTTQILGNVIENNTDGDFGGGIEINGGDGLVVQGNVIRGNVGTTSGGIDSVNTNTLSILDNLVYGNAGQGNAVVAAGGVGLLPPESTVGPFLGVVAGNTITGNVMAIAGDGLAADFAVTGNLGQYIVVNNVIGGPGTAAPATACGETYNYLSITPVVFDHNDVYNPGGPAYAGACPDQTGAYGNISADPQFIDAAGGNFQLATGSPAIDTGNNSAPQMPATDFLGNPRIQDATGLGYPVIDMGAYEAGANGNTTADKPPTTLTLTPSTYFPFQSYSIGVPAGPFTLTAAATSAAGAPVGPVTFYEDQKVVGTVNLSGTGTAQLQPAVPTPGLHAFTAAYPGQGVFSPAVSAKFFVLFPQITPTLSLTSSANPSQLNAPVTFTVTATSPDNAVIAPVTLTDQTTNTTLATLTPNGSGVATFTTSSLALGGHQIIAFYPGDSAHNSASATLYQTVTNGYATTASLASSLNPSTYGQSVTFTAQVTSTTGTPTGTVQLFNGTAPLSGILPLNAAGIATFTAGSLPVGALSVTAAYTPTGSYMASTGYLTQVVNGLATATTVSLTPNPSTYGQPQIFTVHVAPVTANTLVPSGRVLITFCHGATIPFNLDATGSGTVTIPTGVEIPEPVSTCAFSATYQGDSRFFPSTSATLNDIVTPAPSTTTAAATPNPAYALSPVVVSVTVVGNPSPTLSPTGQLLPPGTTVPSGTLTLTDGATPLGTATVTNGKATFSITTLALGKHTLTAAYAADPNLANSAASIVVTVLANTTATTLTASPNPAVQGQTVTLTASVADTTSAAVPAGTVQFFNGATLLGTAPVASTGAASLALAFTPGLQSITAIYAPSSTAFLPSTAAAVALQVAAQDFTFTTTQPSITLQTEHRASLPLTLTSIGGFSGPVSVACTGALPAWLTCEPPLTTTLAANATVTGTLTVDTDQVLNFLARNRPPAAPGSRLPIALASLLPLTLIGLFKRRLLRRTVRGTALAVLALAATSLTACSGYYPHSTAPGIYTVPLTATGTTAASATPITHSLTLTVTVTQ